MASIRPAIPRLVGDSILKHFSPLLQKDLRVQRVHDAYTLIEASLHQTHPKLKLYTFGSAAVYGYHEPESDVDLVALGEDDIQSGTSRDASTQLANSLQSEVLRQLAGSIRSKYFAWHVEEVRRTRVPVIRIKAPQADVDVTAHRRNGVRNSALLRSYFEQKPESRWLSMAVKCWAKKTGMVGPLGYLTSYGFNMLVVYYCIQRKYFSFVDPGHFDVVNIAPLPSFLPLLEPPNSVDLGHQVLDFLGYYLHEFDMANACVSLSRPENTLKSQLNWTRQQEDIKKMSSENIYYRFCIEDPYEVNLNVGRNITPFKLDMMQRHFRAATNNGMLFMPK